MTKMSQEKLLLEKALHKVNMILKVTGVYLNNDDTNRSLINRLKNRWFYCFNFIWVNSDGAGEIYWLINGIVNGKSLVELTYVTPCITFTLLGNLKAFYFIKYAHHVNDLVKALKSLPSIERDSNEYKEDVEKDMIEKRIPLFNITANTLCLSNSIGIVAFGLSSLVLSASNYYIKGEIDLQLPFLIMYPFNAFDIRIWPFVFIHQIWSGFITVYTVLGPDCLYYACCTFIQIQFRSLQYDMARIIKISSGIQLYEVNEAFRSEFKEIVNRHRELIRCIDLMEIIYSKSTLFNVVTSSFLICLTGFNITAIDNLPLMIPFMAFLIMGLVQIFCFCYYSDITMRCSTDLSDAVYNCQWYRVKSSVAKELLFILIRAKKPCKLTAYGFTVINLTAFTKILSTAWSYFALLNTMYQD